MATKLYADMPPLVKQTVASAVINNRNIGSDLVANIVNGILFKANAFYNYAKSGTYPWGLPDGETSYLSTSAYSNVKVVIQSETGKKIYLNYVTLRPTGSDYLYEATYFVLDNQGNLTGSAIPWSYNEGTEVYPSLTLGTLKQTSPYYPIIPIRKGQKNLAEEPEQDDYVPIRQAANYLGINLTDIYDNINEQQEESSENPPEDMYVVMGVSVSSDSLRSKEYLFRYFSQMYGESEITEEDYLYWEGNQEVSTYESNGGSGSSDMNRTPPPQNTVTIKDLSYHQELGYNYISTSTNTGSIAPKGEYVVTHDATSSSGRFTQNGSMYSTRSLYVHYQISKNQYITYQVKGLVYRSKVQNNWVSVDIYDAFNDPDGGDTGEIFIVPLRQDITRQMGSIRSHDLMYDAIRLIVLDHDSYKVKWYQTGFGQLFVLVVAVVVSVVFQQWQAGAAIMTAATAGMVVSQVIIALVMKPLLTILLEDIAGEKLAILITALVMIYAPTLVTDSAGALTGSIAVASPTVYSVASATMTTVTSIGAMRTESALEDIQAEFAELNELIKIQQDESAQTAINVNMISNSISNDPYSIMTPSGFSSKAKYEVRLPTMVQMTTEYYVKTQQKVDKPDSMIRLDVY